MSYFLFFWLRNDFFRNFWLWFWLRLGLRFRLRLWFRLWLWLRLRNGLRFIRHLRFGRGRWNVLALLSNCVISDKTKSIDPIRALITIKTNERLLLGEFKVKAVFNICSAKRTLTIGYFNCQTDNDLVPKDRDAFNSVDYWVL